MLHLTISDCLDLVKYGNMPHQPPGLLLRIKSDNMFARTLQLCEQTSKQNHLWTILDNLSPFGLKLCF